MRALAVTLARLGASFTDIVKMNRWYHAAGTKDAWEPSARATAAFYSDPGPIATAISLPTRCPATVHPDRTHGHGHPDGRALPKTHSWPEGLWDWPIRLPYKHGLPAAALALSAGRSALMHRHR